MFVRLRISKKGLRKILRIFVTLKQKLTAAILQFVLIIKVNFYDDSLYIPNLDLGIPHKFTNY